jgi:hypothetical protein
VIQSIDYQPCKSGKPQEVMPNYTSA